MSAASPVGVRARRRGTRAVPPLVLASLLAALGCSDRGNRGTADCPWSEPPQLALDLRAKVTPSEVPLLGEVVLSLDLYRAPGVGADLDPKVPEGFRARSGAGVRFERPLGAGTWVHRELVLQPVVLGDLVIPPYRVEATAVTGSVAPGTAASTGAGTAADDDAAASASASASAPASADDAADAAAAAAGTQARSVATTGELTVKVTPVLGADAGPAPEAPADPFPPRAEPWPWIAAAGAVVALSLLVWWLTRRRRRPATVPLGRPLPPHEKALRALARLRQAPRGSATEVEAFYVQVSAVLRTYIEEQLGLRAPERTTEEFLAEAHAFAGFRSEQRLELQHFLQQCDLVKFAAVVPPAAVHEETLAIAERFVEQTRPDRHGTESRGAAVARRPQPVGGAS